MALDDVYQITAAQVIAGRECCNTFYYQETMGTGAPTDIVAGALATEFWSAIWIPSWRHLVASNVQLTAVFAYRIWPTVGVSQQQIFSSEFGLRGGVAVPNNATVLVSAQDIANIPNFRRRFYFSGLAEIDQTESSIEPGSRLGWENYATILRTIALAPPSLFPGSFTPIAFSKKLAAIGLPTIPYALLFAARVTYPLRTQRQRAPQFSPVA